MKLPLVSICIPTYNRLPWLLSALESALSQTYKPLEVLVVDNASTDGTVEALAKYKDRRLIIHQRKHNHGMIDNWNLCLKLAKGQYIKYLASDDLLEPTCVAEMVAAAQTHNVPLVCCRRKIINDIGEIVSTIGYSNHDVRIDGQTWAKELIHHRQNTIGEPTAVLLKRSLVKQIGYFDLKFMQLVDVEYWVRIMMRYDAYYLNQPLCSFREHQTSNSQQAQKGGWTLGDVFYLIDKYSSLPNNPLKLNRFWLRFLVAENTQRFIKKYIQMGRYPLAFGLLTRLRKHVGIGEQFMFLFFHTLRKIRNKVRKNPEHEN